MNRNRFLSKVEKEFKGSIFEDILKQKIWEAQNEMSTNTCYFKENADFVNLKKEIFQNMIEEQFPLLDKYLTIVDSSFTVENKTQRFAVNINDIPTTITIEHIDGDNMSTHLCLYIDLECKIMLPSANSKEEFQKQLTILLKELFNMSFSLTNIVNQELEDRIKRSN